MGCRLLEGTSIYYCLFNIEPREGYEAASVEINLMDGRLSRIDSRQVRKGYFLQSEDNVTSLSFDCVATLGRHTEYEKMTKKNWRQYIPQEELEKALKTLPPERYIDNSFTSDDNLAIDGLYIKRSRWSNTTAFYFRKTQTGYRLYHGTCGGDHHEHVFAFDETKCTEEFLYKLFIARPGAYTRADYQKDIMLSRSEFLSIVQSAPDLFAGTYTGTKKQQAMGRILSKLFCGREEKGFPAPIIRPF